MDVDATAPPVVEVPGDVERVVADVTYAGRPIGSATLPGGIAVEPWLLVCDTFPFRAGEPSATNASVRGSASG